MAYIQLDHHVELAESMTTIALSNTTVSYH